MQKISRMVRSGRHVEGRVASALAAAMGIAALAVCSQAAYAFATAQAKPQINVEAERSPQGARLTFKGKGWTTNGRVKITGSRAPGAGSAQDFGMFSADSVGNLSGRKVAACTSNSTDEGSSEQVTITAADSATGAKATTKVSGAAWVCQ